MEKLLKIKLRWSLLFIMIFIIALTMFTQAHEAAHAAICDTFGGKVVYSGWDSNKLTFVTICQAPKSDMLNLAESENEAWGYQLEAALFSVLIIIYCIGWLLVWLKQIEPKRIEGKFLRGDD